MIRVALIHPEGNFNNNPNLLGLLTILAEQGFEVDVYAEQREGLDQTPPANKINVLLAKGQGAFQYDAAFLLPSFIRMALPESAKVVAPQLAKPDLVIGIDRGIIEAHALATVWNVPLGLISYEIWFAEENAPGFKEPEIAACKDLAFAVCQDEARKFELCKENQIPPEKVINIPVAGRGVRKIERTKNIHAALELDSNRKLALYMGELTGPYAGIEEIVESTVNWPEEWALILHHRYGNSAALPLLSKILQAGRKNIFFSPFPTLPNSEMHQLLSSVDVGFAFYRPCAGHPLSDRNLRCIGMASGKIATYLQHGVPVIVNEIGEMSEFVEKYRIGGVVSHGRELQTLLKNISVEPESCYAFFVEKLDLDRTSRELLGRIKEVTTR